MPALLAGAACPPERQAHCSCLPAYRSSVRAGRQRPPPCRSCGRGKQAPPPPPPPSSTAVCHTSTLPTRGGPGRSGQSGGLSSAGLAGAAASRPDATGPLADDDGVGTALGRWGRGRGRGRGRGEGGGEERERGGSRGKEQGSEEEEEKERRE